MTEKVDLLKNMFPNIESSVIGMILENVQFNVERASELLLDMADSKQSSSSEPTFPSGGASSTTLVSTRRGGLGDNQTFDGWPKPFVSAAKTNGSCSPRTSSLGAIGNKMSTGRKNEVSKSLQDCLTDIEKSVKVLVILRGLPGSGKSTLAKR